RDRLARAEIDVMAQSAMFAQVVEMTRAGMDIGDGSSFIKIVATETMQSICDLLLDSAGDRGAESGPIETEDGPVDVAIHWLEARRMSIYAGTSEIQRNVTAKRVLGLP
ncbi:MAG: acyl-CoA dehydrogenase family protein, partial [Alphaproteobacteria bacterium]